MRRAFLVYASLVIAVWALAYLTPEDATVFWAPWAKAFREWIALVMARSQQGAGGGL